MNTNAAIGSVVELCQATAWTTAAREYLALDTKDQNIVRNIVRNLPCSNGPGWHLDHLLAAAVDIRSHHAGPGETVRVNSRGMKRIYPAEIFYYGMLAAMTCLALFGLLLAAASLH